MNSGSKKLQETNTESQQQLPVVVKEPATPPRFVLVAILPSDKEAVLQVLPVLENK